MLLCYREEAGGSGKFSSRYLRCLHLRKREDQIIQTGSRKESQSVEESQSNGDLMKTSGNLLKAMTRSVCPENKKRHKHETHNTSKGSREIEEEQKAGE